MRAAVSARYGPPEGIELREVEDPTPGPTDVLVRVVASTVSRTDCGALRGYPRFARIATGLLRPKHTVLGMDFAGIVDRIGAEVTGLGPGDRVFGLSPESFGAHAELLRVPAAGAIAVMPEGARFDEVVACEGAWYASTYLDAFGLGPGHSILIYGASGAIGTAAVQLAKHRGAEVTAVVGTRHVELARSLGAERVVDFTIEDFTRLGERFDFVLDAVGKTSYSRCKRLLRKGGTFSATDLGPWGQNVLLDLLSRLTRSRRVVFPLPKHARAAVELVRDLLATRAFRAIVDRSFTLDEIVNAYRFVETERKTGIVVLRVAGERADAP